MTIEEDEGNQDVFRECLSSVLITSLTQPSKASKGKRATKGRKNAIKPVDKPSDAAANDAEELSEFIEFIALEIFTCLPTDLRTLSFEAAQSDPSLSAAYDLPLTLGTLESLASLVPPSTADSLITYDLLPSSADLPKFLSAPLSDYIIACLAPPPSATPAIKASACEICTREHIPLTYHHLVPRAVHDRVKKRGWHDEWRLNSVAWLCRACHTFVHGLAGNEELARDWYTVDLLMEREDVQKWAKWMEKVRWKAR